MRAWLLSALLALLALVALARVPSPAAASLSVGEELDAAEAELLQVEEQLLAQAETESESESEKLHLACPPSAEAKLAVCSSLSALVRSSPLGEGQGEVACAQASLAAAVADADSQLCPRVHDHMAAVGLRWDLAQHLASTPLRRFCAEVLAEPVNGRALLRPRIERACLGEATAEDARLEKASELPKGYTGNILEEPFGDDIIYNGRCRCNCPDPKKPTRNCCSCKPPKRHPPKPQPPKPQPPKPQPPKPEPPKPQPPKPQPPKPEPPKPQPPKPQPPKPQPPKPQPPKPQPPKPQPPKPQPPKPQPPKPQPPKPQPPKPQPKSECEDVPGFPYSAEAHIVVDIHLQRMRVYRGGKLEKEYVISTGENGIGFQLGSGKTPYGRFKIGKVVSGKFGQDIAGLVPRPRFSKAGDKAALQTRVFTLIGLDAENSNTLKRMVYIHGTNKEKDLGRPAGEGCFRLSNVDIVDLHSRIKAGALVVVKTKCAWKY